MSNEDPLKKIVSLALLRGGKNNEIPEHSDLAVAEKFATIYGDKYRHVTNRNDWFVYDGKVWTPDDKLQRYTDARHLCSDLARASDRDADKKALTHANTVSDVVKMAGYDGNLIAVIEDFDKDSMLLNTQDGVIDLNTGNLREHRAEDYFSQITSCGVSDAGCPLWLEFLKVVSGGDADLVSYIKRVIGYTLTGSVKEHALFFLYGEGANGKSVFLGVIAGILNTYHRTAAMQTFIVSNSDQHPTDLAGLVGSRAVTASETERGRTWDENKIKTITGGDPVSARFMRGDFFTYSPQYTILIAGNNKPKLKSTDEAIRRRFNLIPFTVTIPLEQRDKDLAEKLKAEYPAILKWAIEGCLEWQQQGLSPPAVVREATEDYIKSQNLVGNWRDERCDVGPELRAMSSDLYANFKEWARDCGEELLKQADFNNALSSLTYGKNIKHGSKRSGGGIVWEGIKISSVGVESLDP